MQYIKGINVTFEYEGEAQALLDNISFEINKGNKIGLIGKNGSGKTTLFKLAIGSICPGEGTIHRRTNLKVGYLPQELDLPDNTLVEDYLWEAQEDINRIRTKLKLIDSFDRVEDLELLSVFDDLGGYKFEAFFHKILSHFELDKSFLSRKISSLSGGEKTKIALCRVILKKPDILLLDEPTNHLDTRTLVWLEEYLKGINIPFLVISHDRKFLDNCTTTIWEIENRKLNFFSGNYSYYKAEKEIDFERRKAAYENQKKKIKQLEKVFEQRKAAALKQEKFKPTRSRKKNGGFCKRDMFKVGIRRDQAMMKSAMAVMSRIDRIIDKEKADMPFIEKKRGVILKDSRLKSNFILQMDELGISFSSKMLFRELSLALGNGNRLAINGRNGSGKTTLLKILNGNLNSYSGNYKWAKGVKIGYFSQEHDELYHENSILEEVLSENHLIQTRARTLLGCLNIKGDKVYQKIKTLSLGERSKVALAKVILSEANVLLLDEPTNHLEISAKEAIEDALLSFNGTIIFVSHDRYFNEKLATEVLDMGNFLCKLSA